MSSAKKKKNSPACTNNYYSMRPITLGTCNLINCPGRRASGRGVVRASLLCDVQACECRTF